MVVLDNPTCFLNPFQFEITFECLQELDDDLEWKVLYVGSAQDATRDQILDEILVGPVPVGVNKFVLQADAPDPSQLAQDDLLGVTVVLVTCSYKEREFVRVGYYVNNEYHDPNAPVIPPNVGAAVPPAAADGSSPEGATEPPAPTIPNPVPLDRIQRQILADKPRVTKFPISWGDEQQARQNSAGATSTGGEGMVGTNNAGVTMMAEVPSMTAGGSMTVTPPGNNDNSIMMQEDEDDIDDDVGVSSSGIVSMPEESNISHAYFGSGGNGGLQAMAE